MEILRGGEGVSAALKLVRSQHVCTISAHFALYNYQKKLRDGGDLKRGCPSVKDRALAILVSQPE